MNKNRIDKIGVAACVNYFCRLGHIDPHIAFDDKVPVWDGSIDIHKTEDGCSKNDIDFNLYVQVKSTECKPKDFSKNVVHSVDIHDLELYKNNGGTLLIKVLVSKSKTRIYFAYLGKVQINNLIEGISEAQKTKDVKCVPAPNTYKELYPELRTIYLQRKHNLITLDELKEKTGFSFSLTAGPMENDADPLDWFANNYTDILVTLPGFSEKFYLSEGPARLFTNHRVNKTVSVNGVEYFKEVKIGNSPEGHVISIDDFLECQFHDFAQNKQKGTKISIKITPSFKYVDEYLNQLKFLEAVYEHKCFSVGDFQFVSGALNITEKEISNVRSEILFFERAINFFERIGLSSHFDFKELDAEEFSKFSFLVKMFNGVKTNNIPKLETPCTVFKIGKYNICIAVDKLDNGYYFYDINDCVCSRKHLLSQDIIYVPVCSYLFENGIFPDNFNYSDIVSQYKKYEIEEGLLMTANCDVLSLITKFDTTNNNILINTAKELAEWIITVNTDEDSAPIYRINLLQIHFRLGHTFTEEDKNFLFSIGKYNSNPLNFAASVLLKEKSRAQSIFLELTDAEKTEIMQFPIYHMYEQLN